MPKGKTCRAKFQASKAEKLTLSGCSSVKKHRPTYCGICTDKRCCLPNKSNMLNIDFHCKGGSNVRWKMQWITSCVCQRKCNGDDGMFSELERVFASIHRSGGDAESGCVGHERVFQVCVVFNKI